MWFFVFNMLMRRTTTSMIGISIGMMHLNYGFCIESETLFSWSLRLACSSWGESMFGFCKTFTVDLATKLICKKQSRKKITIMKRLFDILILDEWFRTINGDAKRFHTPWKILCIRVSTISSVRLYKQFSDWCIKMPSRLEDVNKCMVSGNKMCRS